METDYDSDTGTWTFNITDLDELAPEASKNQPEYYLFPFKNMIDILADHGNVKLSSEAKTTFACAVCSITAEVMEHLIAYKTKITPFHVQHIFDEMDLPYIPNGDQISMRQCFGTYRKWHPEFRISIEASRQLSHALCNAFCDIATFIHSTHTNQSTLSRDDVLNVVEFVVLLRPFRRRKCECRSIHAKQRTRKADGRF